MCWTVFSLAFALLGCGTTGCLRQRLDWLVQIGATGPQLVAEYGEPVDRRADPGALEVLEFMYGTRSSSRSITCVADGVVSAETVTTTVPGKLRVIARLRDGEFASYDLIPNR